MQRYFFLFEISGFAGYLSFFYNFSNRENDTLFCRALLCSSLQTHAVCFADILFDLTNTLSKVRHDKRLQKLYNVHIVQHLTIGPNRLNLRLIYPAWWMGGVGPAEKS